MKKAKITIMGSFVVDLTSRTPHLPQVGETVKGSLFKMGPGGKGSNQAVAAKRAGADVTLITKVGQDAFGEIAIRNFENERIDTQFIAMDREHETGTALIMVDEKTSDNMILVTLGACEHITDHMIESAGKEIEAADIFLTQLETNLDAVAKAVGIAHAGKTRVVLNPAPVQPISDDILRMVDIITPNEVEAEILTGIKIDTQESMREAAQKFMDKGVGDVIITLGSRGVYVRSKNEEMLLKPYPVEAVDTTGAGDAFNGGLVTALAEGKSLVEAAKFASIVGALSVTKMGTAPAMPYREEIEACLE